MWNEFEGLRTPAPISVTAVPLETLPTVETTSTDREAFEALVLRHQAAICAIAYSVLRDRARSEEVAQDALLIAWRDRASVTVTSAWVCGIARNLARNAARRRREVVMEHEPATQDSDAREALIAREDISRANDALAKLPEKHRDAIAIYYRSNESYAEVAGALGISEASARQRVHRARERLRERLLIVESALRMTRPGPSFTAAVVAAWALGRTPPAHAATAPASHAPWLLPAIGVGAIASTVAIAMAVRSAPAAHDAVRTANTEARSVVRRDGVQRRFPQMAGAAKTPRPVLPPGFTAADTPTREPPSGTTHTVDLDFTLAPFPDLLLLFAHETGTPIWSTFEGPPIDIRVKAMPALDALDQALAFAHATRTEVEAINIVEGGRTDAATLGGEPLSINVHDVPLNQILALVEPKLATPIARVGYPFRVTDANGQVIDDQSPRVTLELLDVPAGVVLQRALEQTHLGYELTTGFVITPD